MPVRFHDQLNVRDPGTNGPEDPGGVDATGPKGPGETVLEMCAWVFRQQGADHVAATEMTTNAPPGTLIQNPPDTQIPLDTWRLPLGTLGSVALGTGDAFAVAVALVKEATGEQKVIWWGHPVTLV